MYLYYASNLRKADRYTHVIYQNSVDMQKDIESGIYSDVELPEASYPTQTNLSEKLGTIMGIHQLQNMTHNMYY